jgi:hypothetical protein
MRVGIQQQQTLLVTTGLALWRYDNGFFLPTNRRLILELRTEFSVP